MTSLTLVYVWLSFASPLIESGGIFKRTLALFFIPNLTFLSDSLENFVLVFQKCFLDIMNENQREKVIKWYGPKHVTSNTWWHQQIWK